MARILIADDAAAIAEVLRRYLTRHGHEAETVSDGIAAFERLQSPSPPDLLIADLRMPLLGGRELLALMRRDAILRQVPVILMSGGEFPSDAPESEDDRQVCLGKPFALQSMLGEVERLLAV